MSRQETWRQIMDRRDAVINRLREQRDEHKGQRDELLAALERLVAVFEVTIEDGAGAVWVQAIEAIAKANATGGEK